MTTLSCGSWSQAGWPLWDTAWIAQAEKPADCQIPHCELPQETQQSFPMQIMATEIYSNLFTGCLLISAWNAFCFHWSLWYNNHIKSKLSQENNCECYTEMQGANQVIQTANKTRSTAAKCCEHLYIWSLTASVKTQQAFILKYSYRNPWTNFPAGLPAQFYPPHDDQWI